MAEIVSFPNSCTPEQRAECEVAVSALEQEAEKWCIEADIAGVAKNIASVAQLNRNVPDSVKADFAKRQENMIAAMIEQAWIEGAMRGATGAFDAVRAGYDPNTKTRPTSTREGG